MALPLQFDRTFRPVTNTPLTLSEVRYNGFQFPPALRGRATMEPVYDDSGRIVKYTKISLSISCYLFHGLNVADSPSTNLFSGNYLRSLHVSKTVGGAGHPGETEYRTDDEMDYARSRLMEPGQPLAFTSQGLGSISVQDTNNSNSYDVDNGPKPKLVTWRPLTNKCCYIEWECSASVASCGTIASAIAQFPFTVSFDIDQAGLTVRTISGRLEAVLSRTPNQNSPHAGVSRAFDYATYRTTVLSAFPLLARFQRTQHYELSADRKYVQFTITDREIDSDEAYGEGCAEERVNLSARNRFPQSFGNWEVTMAGSIRLVAGYPKSYAYAEIGRLFTKHYVQSDMAAQRLIAAGNVAPRSLGAMDGSNSSALPRKLFLRTIEFTDQLFARTIDFSISWWLTCRLQDIFKAAGIFMPADPLPIRDAQWSLWKTSLGSLNTGGYSALGFNQNDDVIVSVCQPWTPPTQAPNTTPAGVADKPLADNPDSTEARDSFIHYDARFNIEVVYDSAVHAPLGSYAPPAQSPLTPASARSNTTFTIKDQPSSADPNQATSVHMRREPIYVLHFSGHAIRLNYPVDEPSVKSYGGQATTPFGNATLRPRLLGNAISVADGSSHKVYSLLWHKTYLLPSAPPHTRIESDADPTIYA